MLPDINNTLEERFQTTITNVLVGDKISPAYQEFQDQYRLNPAGFIIDCIDHRGDHPADYQLASAEELLLYGRVCIRALHGAGKTALVSWLVHWFALTRDGVAEHDWKAATTASVWRQLTKFLWPEIHKWSRMLRWGKIGRLPYNRFELLKLSLQLKTGAAFAISSDDHTSIEGAHAYSMFYIYDESKAIKDETFDASEGAFSNMGGGREAFALAISTPGEPSGRFYEIQSRKVGLQHWHARKITKEEAVAAGRVSPEWIELMRTQWGEESALFQNRVEGEFAIESEENIIPLAFVEASNERWYEWRDQGFPGIFTGVGVDVGMGAVSGDATTMALCFDYLKIRDIEATNRGNPMTATMEAAGRIVGILTRYRKGEAIIDMIGVGTGVIDRVRELSCPARGFVASMGTSLMDKSGTYGFRNWRAAGWWLLRELLEPNSGFDVCLPPIDSLTTELTTTKKIITSSGIIQVEEKAQIKKRLGKSTDYADAVIHILIGPALIDQATRDGQDVTRLEYVPIQIGPNY